MTPEQLEAHRVRFEQQYTSCVNLTPEQIKSERREGSYTSLYPSISWQAYQWALADVARAQRAAPGVQEGETWHEKADRLKKCVDYSPIGLDLMNHREALSAHLHEQPLYTATQPPQQSAQPVERKYISPVKTVADLVNNLLMMDQTLPIYGAQYIEHSTRGRCAIAVSPTVSRERVADSRWIGRGAELNAAVVWTRAAQPVEVQPLTNGQVSEGQDSNGLFPGSAASCAFTMGVRYAESKHGIKPTSSEGG